MKSKKTGIILVIFILFVSCGLFTLLSQFIRDTKLVINDENFNTKLKNSNIFPKEPEIKTIGENITFSINYTSGNPPEQVVDASVYYYIQVASVNISTELLNFSEVSPGIYNKTIDTSKPIDSGGATLNSSIMYEMVVIARKVGLPEENCSIYFLLNLKNSSLTPNVTSLEVIWEKNISLEVHYQGTLGPIDLDGASVNYNVPGVSGLFGSLIPQGNGIYRLILNTSLFPEANGREYTIEIVASMQNYETRGVDPNVRIYDIPTKLNGTISYNPLLLESEVFLGVEKIFTFSYTNNNSGIGISDAEVAEYHWKKYIDGVLVDQGFNTLNDFGNGLYELDFDTESLGIANYQISVDIKKTYYEKVYAIIILNILKRESLSELYINQENKTSDNTPYKYVVGNTLNITIKYKDRITGLHIPSAVVNITCGSGFSSNLEENGTQYTLIFDPLANNFQWGINTIIITVESSDHKNVSIIMYITMMPFIPDINIPQLLIPGPDILIIILISLIGVMSLILYYKTKIKIHSFSFKP